MCTDTLLFLKISHSHVGDDGDYCLVYTDAMLSGRYVSKFQGKIAASLFR